jgi:hypothetical protein
MAAVYFYRVGLSLLIVSATGGWLVFLVGYLDSLPLTTALPGRTYRLAVRHNLRVAAPLDYDGAREVLHGSTRSLAHAYAASAPVIALGFTSSIWELSNAGLAWITLPAAILYALAALALWHFGEVSFSRTHALVRLLFLTLTLVLVLDGDALFIILAAGAAILPYLAKRYSDGAISVGGICCPASPGSGSPPASSPILWTLLARLARRSPTYPPPSTYPLSLSRSPPRTRSCRAPRPESTGPWRTRRFWPGCGVGSRSSGE